jgi:hypothetical protein
MTPGKGIAAHFMNLHIQINELQPSLFGLRKFDKRRSLPFTYTQYIKFKSNRAVHQAYNIVVSQLVPILYISSSATAAMDEIMILISTMSGNGFYKPRLLRIINQFLARNHFPGVRFNTQEILSSLHSQGDYTIQ